MSRNQTRRPPRSNPQSPTATIIQLRKLAPMMVLTHPHLFDMTLFYPPHRQRGTPPRKHFPRVSWHRDGEIVTRLNRRAFK